VALSVKWEFGAGKSGVAGVFLVQLLGARLGGRQQGGWHFESAVVSWAASCCREKRFEFPRFVQMPNCLRLLHSGAVRDPSRQLRWTGPRHKQSMAGSQKIWS
jgi:hypothetical protein